MRFLPVACALISLSACDESFAPEDFEDATCEDKEPTAFVDWVAREWYLQPDQLPDLELREGAAEAFLEELIEAVDLDPESSTVREDRFTYLTSVEAFEQARDGDYVGVGTNHVIEGEEGARFLRLVEVFGSGPLEPPTPASEAGLRRGDRIFAVNGVDIAEQIARRGEGTSEAEVVASAFGEEGEGVAIGLVGERIDGTPFSVSPVRRPVTFREVPMAETVGTEEDRIGYMVFRSFATEGAEDELLDALTRFERQGVTRVIVDLRYNSGGWLNVAEAFAGQLLGKEHIFETVIRLAYNPSKSDYDFRFKILPRSCTESSCSRQYVPLSALEEIVFIVSNATGSASEALINGLSPLIPVRLVGSQTRGKAVAGGVFRNDACDQVFVPITSYMLNGLGEGKYFDGLTPDCLAADDTSRQYGDPAEASFAAALSLLQTDTCPAQKASPPATSSPRPRGFESLVVRH